MTAPEQQPDKQAYQGVNLLDWGLLPYAEAYQRQIHLLNERIAGRCGDTIALVEHPHVFTYGRSSVKQVLPETVDVLGQAVSQVTVERGGDVTYHGPGQLVIYPILDVRALTGDSHQFLFWLEDVLIETIAHWGIAGRHHPEHTGVWVEDRKIASIGVAVRKWISYHGAALNVSTDLRYFGAISPCGLPSEVMTSMTALTGQSIALSEIKTRLREILAHRHH